MLWPPPGTVRSRTPGCKLRRQGKKMRLCQWWSYVPLMGIKTVSWVLWFSGPCSCPGPAVMCPFGQSKRKPLWIRENLIVYISSHKPSVYGLNVTCKGILFGPHGIIIFLVSVLKIVTCDIWKSKFLASFDKVGRSGFSGPIFPHGNNLELSSGYSFKGACPLHGATVPSPPCSLTLGLPHMVTWNWKGFLSQSLYSFLKELLIFNFKNHQIIIGILWHVFP